MKRGDVVSLRERVYIAGVTNDTVTSRIECLLDADSLTHVVAIPKIAGVPMMVCGDMAFMTYAAPAPAPFVTCLFCAAGTQKRW